MSWLRASEVHLPTEWPPELPPEETPAFWFTACKFEMSTRGALSGKVRLMIAGAEFAPLTPLEGWLLRRRFEWAGQVALSKVLDRVEPRANLIEVLEWALIGTWNTDGCIGMWKHAERGGKPHPENPDGLAPNPPK
jgi:hypothetical protein